MTERNYGEPIRADYLFACPECGLGVIETVAHDKFHDNLLTRRASFANVDMTSGDTFVQFIDGTTLTLSPVNGKSIDSEVIMGFMKEVNEKIEKGWLDV